ncbi:unnamed protein product [Rhizophagus irregularis]|nr:unnamed protein product [Rhizophagus irregularis]CAB5371692.1 unnamed protein product [Rhizophagus irregularis]
MVTVLFSMLTILEEEKYTAVACRKEGIRTDPKKIEKERFSMTAEFEDFDYTLFIKMESFHLYNSGGSFRPESDINKRDNERPFNIEKQASEKLMLRITEK